MAIAVVLSPVAWVVVVGLPGSAMLLAIDVAFPIDVIGPVRFALVVTVAALPVVFWFHVGTVPERIEYGIAVIHPGFEYEPLVYTPLVTVPAFPVTLPAIALVTVRFASVPTEVSEEVTTLDARVVPVSVPAAAAIVPEDPSVMLVPFTVRASFVRYALSIVVPCQTPLEIVPRLVRDDPVTPLARVLPVRVPAAAATVMLPVPSKVTPFMVRPVCSAVAVAALPVVLWFQVGIVPERIE